MTSWWQTNPTISPDPEDFDVAMKFIMVGDSGVGKSCLLLRFTHREFRRAHDLTIGVEFGVRRALVGDVRVKLQIWDTAGQEAFKSITRSFYRSAVAALLVYDVTRRYTFKHLNSWRREMVTHAGVAPVVTVVANKIDCVDAREVTPEEGRAFADAWGADYVETSAFSGVAVERAFLATAEGVLRQEVAILDQGRVAGGGLKLATPTPASPTGAAPCCA